MFHFIIHLSPQKTQLVSVRSSCRLQTCIWIEGYVQGN